MELRSRRSTLPCAPNPSPDSGRDCGARLDDQGRLLLAEGKADPRSLLSCSGAPAAPQRSLVPLAAQAPSRTVLGPLP